MSPQVLGLDLSVSSTGVALPNGSTATVKPKPASLKGGPRLTVIWRSVRELLTGTRPELIVIEDYAPGAVGLAGKLTNAELHGVIMQRLSSALPDATFARIRPSTLKRWATGNGMATKQQMVAAARSMGWVGADKADDEADAFLLHRLGLMALTGVGDPDRLAVCDQIAWPR